MVYRKRLTSSILCIFIHPKHGTSTIKNVIHGMRMKRKRNINIQEEIYKDIVINKVQHKQWCSGTGTCSGVATYKIE